MLVQCRPTTYIYSSHTYTHKQLYKSTCITYLFRCGMYGIYVCMNIHTPFYKKHKYSSRVLKLYSCLDIVIYVCISKHGHMGINVCISVCLYVYVCEQIHIHISVAGFLWRIFYWIQSLIYWLSRNKNFSTSQTRITFFFM